MIQAYEFDDKNANGDKERRLAQQTSLINKLSANEINNLRNKVNEIITKLNLFQDTPVRVILDLITLKFTVPVLGNVSTILNKSNPSKVIYYNLFPLTNEIEITLNAEIGDTIEILFN